MNTCDHNKTTKTIEWNDTWDDAPNLTANDYGIAWFGTCECGERVYETYVPEDEPCAFPADGPTALNTI